MPSRRRNRRSALDRWATFLVAFLFGLGFTIATIVQERDLRALERRGQVTDAFVLDESGGRNAFITVRFTAQDGQVVESDTSNYKEPVEVGDTIQVVYDASDPFTFQHERYGYGRGLIVFSGVIGIAGLLMSWYVYVRGVPDWMDRR